MRVHPLGAGATHVRPSVGPLQSLSAQSTWPSQSLSIPSSQISGDAVQPVPAVLVAAATVAVVVVVVPLVPPMPPSPLVVELEEDWPPPPLPWDERPLLSTRHPVKDPPSATTNGHSHEEFR